MPRRCPRLHAAGPVGAERHPRAGGPTCAAPAIQARARPANAAAHPVPPSVYLLFRLSLQRKNRRAPPPLRSHFRLHSRPQQTRTRPPADGNRQDYIIDAIMSSILMRELQYANCRACAGLAAPYPNRHRPSAAGRAEPARRRADQTGQPACFLERGTVASKTETVSRPFSARTVAG